jgi:hypothetical protein
VLSELNYRKTAFLKELEKKQDCLVCLFTFLKAKAF